MPKDIRIGGMGPLSAPGFISAGKDLRAGMTAAVDRLNAGGGVLRRRLALAFEDSAGRPDAGVAAIARLVARGVCVLAGEFHSVVADAMVVPIDRTGIPFVCASATLDTITTRRLPGIFRLSPAQSHSWSIFADYLLGTRVGHVIALLDDSAYWAAGAALAVAAAIEAAGSTEPTAVAEALRSVRTAGTRGEIRFSTTAEPPVHQQWRWPPVCLLAQRAAGRPLTAAQVLFDPRS